LNPDSYFISTILEVGTALFLLINLNALIVKGYFLYEVEVLQGVLTAGTERYYYG